MKLMKYCVFSKFPTMYSGTVLLFTLFFGLAQQSSELDHINNLKLRNTLIQARQGEDLSYCFSSNSICTDSTDLFDLCNGFEGSSDLTQWFQCICGNGYVTADTECDWCQDAYSIEHINNQEDNTSMCSEYNGGTIAPLPSSVLAAVSAFNATYTGVILGGGSGATVTDSGAAASTKTSSESAAKTSSSTSRNTRSSSLSVITQPAVITQTLDGGSFGTSTALPTSKNGGGDETSTSPSPSTSVQPGSGSGTGSAQGWNTGSAVMFSALACGLAVWCLL